MDAASTPQHRLTEQAARWDVIVDEIRETPSSLIAFGRRDTRSVVLKIVKVEGDEWHSGGIVRAFAGRGMVRVEEHEPGALLLERLSPGVSLVTMSRDGDDVEATEILASVIGAFLRNPGEVPSLFLDAEVTERRAVQLATALQCDATRVLQWAFAQAVLSAIWSVEDKEPLASPAPILLFAETVERILGRS